MFDELIEETATDTATATSTFEEIDALRQEKMKDLVANLVTQPGYKWSDMDTRYSGAINLREVRSAKVVVIGAGNIGSHVVKELVGMGFTSVHVIDFDIVEPHNVGVQDHTLVDAYYKRPKVEALSRKMPEYRGVEIVAHNAKVDNYWDIRRLCGDDISFVIVTVDNMVLRNNLAKEILSQVYPPSMKAHWYIDLRCSLNQFTSCVLRAHSGASEFYESEVDAYNIFKEQYMFSDEDGLAEPCTARAIIYTGTAVASYCAALVHYLLPITPGSFDDSIGDKIGDFFDLESDSPFHWTETFHTREWRTLTRNPKRVKELRDLRTSYLVGKDYFTKKIAAALVDNNKDLEIPMGISSQPAAFWLRKLVTSAHNVVESLTGGEAQLAHIIEAATTFETGKAHIWAYANEGDTPELALVCINSVFFMAVKKYSGGLAIQTISPEFVQAAMAPGRYSELERDLVFVLGEYPEYIRVVNESYSYFGEVIPGRYRSSFDMLPALLAVAQKDRFSAAAMLAGVERTGVTDGNMKNFLELKKGKLQELAKFLKVCGVNVVWPVMISELLEEEEPGQLPEDLPGELPEEPRVQERSWVKFYWGGVLSGWVEVVEETEQLLSLEIEGRPLALEPGDVVLRTLTQPNETTMESEVRRVTDAIRRHQEGAA